MIEKIKNDIEKSIKDLTDAKIKIDVPSIDGPDFSLNIAMQLAKKLKKSPRTIAEDIKKRIENLEYISKIEIAGPGFINIFLKNHFYYDVLDNACKKKDEYGSSNFGKNKKILVEFVSANPTGPMVVVSGRAASVGDSLVRIMKKAGFDAYSEYYVNDAGNQAEKFAESLMAYYKHIYWDEELNIPEGGYGGEYVKELMEDIIKEKAENEDILELFRRESVKRMMDNNKKILEIFRVYFDYYQSEKEIRDSGIVDEVFETLKKNGKIIQKEGALWFSVSEDKEWVVKKTDGNYTYIMPDIAYHKHKYDRGYDKMIDLFGPDHHGHIERMKEMIKAIGLNEEKMEFVIIQFVALLKDGEKLEMSKRKGTFVSLEEFLQALTEMIGKKGISEESIDAARYFFVRRKNSSHLNFDMNLAVSTNDENPVYYVQYAYARIKSLFRRADIDFDVLIPDKISDFTEEERKILRHISLFPEKIKEISINYNTHEMPFYLEELSSMFHSYYYNNRFIQEDKKLQNKRLNIAKSVAIVIKNGLSLIGVNAPERM